MVPESRLGNDVHLSAQAKDPHCFISTSPGPVPVARCPYEFWSPEEFQNINIALARAIVERDCSMRYRRRNFFACRLRQECTAPGLIGSPKRSEPSLLLLAGWRLASSNPVEVLP